MSRIYGLPSRVVRILLLVMLAVSVYALLADTGIARMLGVAATLADQPWLNIVGWVGIFAAVVAGAAHERTRRTQNADPAPPL